MTTTKTRQKPRPKRPKRAALLPGQVSGPGGHTGFPVRGCGCWLCATHRAAEREAAETRALEVKYDGEPLVEGSVLLAPNASAELRAVLGVHYDL